MFTYISPDSPRRLTTKALYPVMGLYGLALTCQIVYTFYYGLISLPQPTDIQNASKARSHWLRSGMG